MRRVKYWNDLFIEQGACFTWIDEDRQTIHFNGAKEGLFHQWATISGDTVAIVENYEGQIELVEPSFIKFIPNSNTDAPIYEALSFIQDTELRHRVVNVFNKMNEYH